jgi:7-cyano-7-deazaguanine synthase
MNSAFVLFSGGKDSTVSLAWAAEKFARVVALEFEVPHRPAGESRAAQRIAAEMGLELRTVPLPFLSDVASLGRSTDAAARQTAGAYVPARNLIFHSVAFHLAQCSTVATVVAGHIASDGSAYRDATSIYLRRIYRLAADGTDCFGTLSSPELALPLDGLSDGQVIALGRQLNAPLHLSWSCLQAGSEPCGSCVSCRDRQLAFEAGTQSQFEFGI